MLVYPESTMSLLSCLRDLHQLIRFGGSPGSFPFTAIWFGPPVSQGWGCQGWDELRRSFSIPRAHSGGADWDVPIHQGSRLCSLVAANSRN